MTNQPAKVINTLLLNGKEFIISSKIRPCGKIGYHAHELGGVSQWGQITGSGERIAHRVNPSHRVKGRHWVPRPFKTQEQAEVMAIVHSELDVRYF